MEKVKKIALIVELEGGKSFVAKVNAIGDIKNTLTLNDLTKQLSNEDCKLCPKFISPIVFTLDLQAAAQTWIRELQRSIYECAEIKDTDYILGKIHWIKNFFNLDEEVKK